MVTTGGNSPGAGGVADVNVCASPGTGGVSTGGAALLVSPNSGPSLKSKDDSGKKLPCPFPSNELYPDPGSIEPSNPRSSGEGCFLGINFPPNPRVCAGGGVLG